MHKTFMITLAAIAAAASVSAQNPPAATVRITVDDAVRLALEHDLDLTVARFAPQIGDAQVAAANGAFTPAVTSKFDRQHSTEPGANFLSAASTRTTDLTSNIGLAQRLPWFGTSYDVSWSASRIESNSFLSAYDPLMLSGVAVNVSQPLLRDFAVDSSRHQLLKSKRDRDIADLTLREQIVQTTSRVKAAYWNLVSARAAVDARTSDLRLADELARVNAAKTSVGQSPERDLFAAQAEVAANQERLIIAETAAKTAEDRLRLLIFDTSDRAAWSIPIEPIDATETIAPSVYVDSAIARALADRTDLNRARKEIEQTESDVKFTSNQRLPDVRLRATYQANGLGGTELLRSGGFPGTVTGGGVATDFGAVINQVDRGDYPTWAAGVSVSYPIGQSADEANHARSKLARAQAAERLQNAEAHAVLEIREAARTIAMNRNRMDTTRVARDLAEHGRA